MEKEYRGQNGTILVEERGLVIKRGAKGFLMGGGMLRGDKTLPYSSIVAVQFKKAGMVQGYIQFTLMGGSEAKGGWQQALKDENTVSFNAWGDNNKRFAELKTFVEGKMGFQHNVAPVSSLDELEKLAALKDKGIITEEEFQKKKKQLLEM
jgi:hypothetical protein